MRVAVTQFATSLNTQENLATCIRMINEAAVCKPSIIVLPEFCNTQSWYVDHNQAWDQALTIDGTFLQSIAQQAKAHDCYIVLNVTLRREQSRDHQNGSLKSKVSVTSCLLSPQGEIILQADKQTLIGHENDFFISSLQDTEVATTPFGKLALLSGSDANTFDLSRELALHGAQLLCSSLNSLLTDESCLHGPARSCENNVFLATANKVGALVAEEQSTIIATQRSIPEEQLVGIGQSQIVSPDGKVLASIANNKEGFVFADIDLVDAGIDSNKNCRPDGTEFFKQRRADLYQSLTLPNQQLAKQNDNVPLTANVAIFATYTSNEQALEDVCYYIENNVSDIIQLPELFFIADKTLTNNAEELSKIESLSGQAIAQISAVLRPFQYVCTSLVIDGMHQAVIISAQGLFAQQQQLHFCQRYQWTSLGDDLNIIELSLEQGSINVAMLTADDVKIPEIIKIASLNGIHLLLVPFDIQEPCDVEHSLLARAAENRICIVAATREKNFADKSSSANSKGNKIKLQKSTGLIANLTADFSTLPQWQAPKFNGSLNQPIVTHQHGKITKAVIHPIAACYKLMKF